MSSIQLKIIQREKKQNKKNDPQLWEKSFKENKPRNDKKRVLTDKEVKTTTRIVLQMLKKVEENMNTMKREINDIQKDSKWMSWDKRNIIRNEYAFDWLNSSLNTAEEKNNHPENIALESIQNKAQREKRLKK